MYPILGYIGLVLLLVLLVAWIREKKNIMSEKFIRRKMIGIVHRNIGNKDNVTYKDNVAFNNLGKNSIIDTDQIKEDIIEYAKDA